jgi:hypothetical protein
MCIQLIMKVKVKVKQSLYKTGQALRVAESWGTQISRHLAHEGGKFVRPMHWPPVPLQKIFLVLISVRGWVHPKAIVWPEGLYQEKIPLTLAGNNAAISQLAAQCLNQLCHCMPLLNMKYKTIIQSYLHKNKRTIIHSVQYIMQYLQWLENTLICDKKSSIEQNACVTIHFLNADLKIDISF